MPTRSTAQRPGKVRDRDLSRTRLLELTFAEDGARRLRGLRRLRRRRLISGLRRLRRRDAELVAEVRQFIAEASVRGELFELPAVALRAASAFSIDATCTRWTATRPSIRWRPTAFGPDRLHRLQRRGPDIDADDHNTDLYAEVDLPLLGDRRRRDPRDVLGYRYSIRVGRRRGRLEGRAALQPVPSVMLRGSYPLAVRMPSIFELYEPRQTNVASMWSPATSKHQRKINPPRSKRLCVVTGRARRLLDDFCEFEFPV